MKIALAQLNYHIGNFEGNLEKIRRATEDAIAQGADLVCFSELSVCGYPPRDFLEFDDFIRRCQASIEALLPLSRQIDIVVGSPRKNPRLEGKDLYNSAFFLSGGGIAGIADKALLPTYDVFDEYRYFEPAREFRTFTSAGKTFALTVCEDIWNVGNENPLYTICPLDELSGEKFDFILNISASPFHAGQADGRKHVVRSNVRRYGAPMFYVNQVGAQTEIVFDGGSLVMDPEGRVYDEMPYFDECLRVYDLDAVIAGGRENELRESRVQLIYEAIRCGIRDYFSKMNLKRAILGLSGGIDSALTAVLAADALGAENVRCVLMPSRYSTGHSVSDAEELAKTLGTPYDIIAIEDMFQATLHTLEPFFAGKPMDVTEENFQARLRAIILMGLSNKFGYILLNTTNKSEMAVGYGTLYGDLCGGLSVLGDVYKTEVYDLAAYVNRERAIIPENIIRKPPSAELRPNQKDSDSLPEYDILDQVLLQYIEHRKGPRELVDMGFEEALVNRVLRLVNMNEFKRHQTAPVIRVSPKAFGVGRRMPIVGKYLS